MAFSDDDSDEESESAEDEETESEEEDVKESAPVETKEEKELDDMEYLDQILAERQNQEEKKETSGREEDSMLIDLGSLLSINSKWEWTVILTC